MPICGTRNLEAIFVDLEICSLLLGPIVCTLYSRSIAKPFLFIRNRNHWIFMGNSLVCQSFVTALATGKDRFLEQLSINLKLLRDESESNLNKNGLILAMMDASQKQQHQVLSSKLHSQARKMNLSGMSESAGLV